MPSIAEIFPSLAAVALGPVAEEALRYEFDPANRIALLTVMSGFGAVAAEQGTEVEALIIAGSGLLNEIDRELSPGTLAHDVLGFTIGTVTAEILQTRGEQIGTIAYLQRARAVPAPGGGWSVRPERLRLWAPMADLLDLQLLELSLRHFSASFGAAWLRPELDDLADVLWAYTDPAILQAYSMTAADLAKYGLDSDAALIWALETAFQRMQWALRSRRRDARAEYAVWEPLLELKETSRQVRKMLLSFAAVSTEAISERPQAELAERVFREFNGDLSPPLELRLHISACGGSEDELVRRLPDIIDACERHRTFDSTKEGQVELAYTRSQDTVAIAWAMRTLVNCRLLGEAMTLLRAWLPTAADGPSPRTPLFMMPTSRVGTLWASEQQLAPTPDGPETRTLATLIATIDATFATSYELRSDRPWDEPEDATGRPVATESIEYLRRTEEHLRLDVLGEFAPAVPPSALIIPWPMMRLPVQALMVRHIGRTWPISASLVEPRSERALRKIVVMGTGSHTSELERQAVRHCFTRIGAEVHDLGAATLKTFAASYEDPGVDVLWLCSHGTQHLARPHRSGLDLDDGEFAPLSQLARLTPPASADRRLLVLNVCDAGAAPMMEGSWSLGVAAVLAGQTQSVISHMWPVNPFVAAAFAGLLASELTTGAPTHLDAFSLSLALLGGGQESIGRTLRERELAEIAERVENNDVSWDSVLAWGSPVLVT